MSVLTHLWVSPRGRAYTVSNHTAWAAKAMKQALPGAEDPEYQAEENKLYDRFYRLNWMRVLADHARRSLFVDNLVTGDHYRWIAREGARGAYEVYDTDGKEIANFQPKRKKKQQESLDPKDFIMGQPPIYFSPDENEAGRTIVYLREPSHTDKNASYGRGLAYLRTGPRGFFLERLLGNGGAIKQYLRAKLYRLKWQSQEEAGCAIWDALKESGLEEASDRELKQIVQRLRLGAGAQAYACEALDVKDWLMQQPIFNIRQNGHLWGVSAEMPVPPKLAKVGHLTFAPLLGYIAEDVPWTGQWNIQSFLWGDSNLPGTHWPTKEAAAEAMWKEAGPKVLAYRYEESAPEGVKKWIMKLRVPKPNEVEYQVWSRDGHHFKVYNAQKLQYITGYRTLEQAHGFALSLGTQDLETGQHSVPRESLVIKKVHFPSSAVLAVYNLSASGGLLPESAPVDPKGFIIKQPDMQYCVVISNNEKLWLDRNFGWTNDPRYAFPMCWDDAQKALDNVRRKFWVDGRRLTTQVSVELLPQVPDWLQKLGEAQEPFDHKKEMLRLLVPEETLASLGYREVKQTDYLGWVKGPFPLTNPFQTEQQYTDEDSRTWNDKFTWDSAIIRCGVADHGWHVGLTLEGSLEGSAHRQTSELFTVVVRAPAHPNRSTFTDTMSDEEWPIYGGYDFSTPLIKATKMLEAEVPLLDEKCFSGGARVDMRDRIQNTLRSELPEFYKESVDVKRYVLGMNTKYRIRKMLSPQWDRQVGLPPTEYWLRVADYAEPNSKLYVWVIDKEQGTIFTADEAEQLRAKMDGHYDLVQEAAENTLRSELQESVDVKHYVLGTPDAKYRIRKMIRLTRNAQGNRQADLPFVEHWLKVADYAESNPQFFVWHPDKKEGTIFTAEQAEWMATKMDGHYDIVQEAVDPRQFIMNNGGEMLFYICEYIENTRDPEVHALRVGLETEIKGDEAKARTVAVNLARKAAENPEGDVKRVELECWDIPVNSWPDGDAPAKLMHIYWVKADGTFEEIRYPADPARNGVVGESH